MLAAEPTALGHDRRGLGNPTRMIGRVKMGRMGAERMLEAAMVAMTIGKQMMEMTMMGREDFRRCFSSV